MKEYYQKNSHIWLALLSLVAIVMLLEPSAYSSPIGLSVINKLPTFFKDVLVCFLLLLLVEQLLVKNNGSKAVRFSRYVGYAFVGLLFFDIILLQSIDCIIWVSALTETPAGLFDSMIYMAVKSRQMWVNGLIGTVSVSFLGTVIGFLVAVLLVFIRVNQPIRRNSSAIQLLKTIGITLEKFYVSIIRGTPMMVQGCIIYYAGFMLTRALMVDAPISAVNRVWTFYMAALITVSLNTSAYLAEVLRGGVESLDKGQQEACEALGFTKWQALRKVIFPQAVRSVLPSIANEFINNIKGTSVLNVFGFVEIMFATSSVAGFYYKYLAAYMIAAVLYYGITFSMTALMDAMLKNIVLVK